MYFFFFFSLFFFFFPGYPFSESNPKRFLSCDYVLITVGGRIARIIFSELLDFLSFFHFKQKKIVFSFMKEKKNHEKN